MDICTQPKYNHRVEVTMDHHHSKIEPPPFPAPVVHMVRENSSWHPVDRVMGPNGQLERYEQRGENDCVPYKALSSFMEPRRIHHRHA